MKPKRNTMSSANQTRQQPTAATAEQASGTPIATRQPTPAAGAPETAATCVIANISPCLEGGKYPVKRTVGDDLVVEADVFKDGHDILSAALAWRVAGGEWKETPMRPLENDRWTGTLPVEAEGILEYRVTAWGDTFASWQHEIEMKVAGKVPDLSSETLEGAALVDAAAARASGADAEELGAYAAGIRSAATEELVARAHLPALEALMQVYADRSLETSSEPLKVWADRRMATFAAWYEFFPRSAEGKPDAGSGFRDCLGRVDYAKEMGFDVIYFPPIHPIGETKRKGRNNSLVCEPGDPGVPYAIGNRKQGVNGGGHKDVSPELGTLEDFGWLVSEIRSRGMEVALDFAINCSPDHPYVHEHPEWFFKRPDGSIKYAENPPKKYEDVYPLNFHNPDWRGLWAELRDVIAFWCERGVRIFRVDNPHTKPVAFWEWTISEIRSRFPDTIFLSEAFTRPKMMQVLAKAGFTQSYTYFTWRNSKYELEQYLTELSRTDLKDYFRPNFFANTPDILPFFLQEGGRPAFCIRAVLAATLSPLYGIYSGFELCENTPIPGREEYLDSEKYHFKGRDWDAPGNIKILVGTLNSIRRQNRAFHSLDNVRFHLAENDNILFYSKASADGENVVFVAVTHDPRNAQSAYVNVPLGDFGIPEGGAYLMEDLLTGETFRWTGARNFIALDPRSRPAHIFRLKRPAGTIRGEEVFA